MVGKTEHHPSGLLGNSRKNEHYPSELMSCNEMEFFCNEMGSLRQDGICFNGEEARKLSAFRNVFKTVGDMALCNKVPKYAA